MEESRTRSVVDSNCRGPTPAPVAPTSEIINACDAAYIIQGTMIMNHASLGGS